jgi:hypothetical protein
MRRGGVWQYDKYRSFKALGELLMKLKVLDREKYHYHFNFSPNPFIKEHSLFIKRFTENQ